MDEESLTLAKRVTTVIIVALVVGPLSVAMYFYYQGYFSSPDTSVPVEIVEVTPEEVEKKAEAIKTLLEIDSSVASATPEQTNATVKLLEADKKANPVEEAEVERRQKEMLKLLESQ